MTILVTGATGTVGRQVVAELVRRGERVRALTRDPAKANFPAGVETVRADLTDPETLIPALEGVTGLHLITFGEWAEGVRTEDGVSEPFVDRLSAMVHEADIGAVAAVALTEAGHAGRTYALTGPETLTVRDKVRILAAARGKDIGLTELSAAQAAERWQRAGMDQETIDFLLDVYGNTPEVGRTVVDTVERVTGRPARTFAEWAQEHADVFRAQD
ncbi:NmrA family NAD(P)-binding protein [Streptomyces flavidovirens]|uniref:NmrA family NAD(P)-binding protein n=1 Tax=Streptomyces flavidovirens TaxID=67298 RepID=UPI00342F7E72